MLYLNALFAKEGGLNFTFRLNLSEANIVLVHV